MDEIDNYIDIFVDDTKVWGINKVELILDFFFS